MPYFGSYSASFSWDTNEIGCRGSYCCGLHLGDFDSTTSGSSSEACWRASSSGSSPCRSNVAEASACLYHRYFRATSIENFAAYSDTCDRPDHRAHHHLLRSSAADHPCSTDADYSGILNVLGSGNLRDSRTHKTGYLRPFEQYESVFAQIRSSEPSALSLTLCSCRSLHSGTGQACPRSIAST